MKPEFVDIEGSIVNFANIALVTEVQDGVFHQRDRYCHELAVSLTVTDIRKSSLNEFTDGQYGRLVFINKNEIVSVTAITDGNGGCNIVLLENDVVWVAQDKEVILNRLMNGTTIDIGDVSI